MKNLRTSYKHYKANTSTPVEITTYLSMCADFNKFLIDKVIEGEEITLPSRFGTLAIVGKEQKVRFDEQGNVVGLPPNWRKTKELWNSNPQAKQEKRIVYCTNEHTSNIRYKFFWSKKRVIIENKTLYALRITRTNKRRVHKKILEGKEYFNQ